MSDGRTNARVMLVAGRILDALAHNGDPRVDDALDFAYGDVDDPERWETFAADLVGLVTVQETGRGAVAGDDRTLPDDVRDAAGGGTDLDAALAWLRSDDATTCCLTLWPIEPGVSGREIVRGVLDIAAGHIAQYHRYLPGPDDVQEQPMLGGAA